MSVLASTLGCLPQFWEKTTAYWVIKTEYIARPLELGPSPPKCKVTIIQPSYIHVKSLWHDWCLKKITEYDVKDDGWLFNGYSMIYYAISSKITTEYCYRINFNNYGFLPASLKTSIEMYNMLCSIMHGYHFLLLTSTKKVQDKD